MVRSAKGQDLASKGDSTEESKDAKRRSRSRSRENQASTDGKFIGQLFKSGRILTIFSFL